MTSAFQGSWADDGLKGLLGRKRPTGLGPTSPDEGSPLILPGLLVKAPFTRWASTAAQRAGCHMRPSGLSSSRYQGRGVLPLPKAHAAPDGGAASPPATVAAAIWACAGVR
jgi:hypothetical protein